MCAMYHFLINHNSTQSTAFFRVREKLAFWIIQLPVVTDTAAMLLTLITFKSMFCFLELWLFATSHLVLHLGQAFVAQEKTSSIRSNHRLFPQGKLCHIWNVQQWNLIGNGNKTQKLLAANLKRAVCAAKKRTDRQLMQNFLSTSNYSLTTVKVFFLCEPNFRIPLKAH